MTMLYVSIAASRHSDQITFFADRGIFSGVSTVSKYLAVMSMNQIPILYEDMP